MPKKRKSESAGLEEVERSLFSTFCTAANSISQLYSLAHNQQRVGFLAGERHALARLQQWLEGGAQSVTGTVGSSYISREKLLDFIQGELDRVEDGWPVQGSAGTPSGNPGGNAQIPPRGSFGGAGVQTSNLLSQLNHCHIRPRSGPVDSSTAAAVPAGSACWEMPARPNGDPIPQAPVTSRLPASYCSERPETGQAPRPASGGYGGAYQSQPEEFAEQAPEAHLLQLKNAQRLAVQQDAQQDSPLAGSASGSVPPLEALDTANASYAAPFGVGCSSAAPVVCSRGPAEGEEHFLHVEQLRNYGAQHQVQQLQRSQQDGVVFGHLNFLDADHQSDGGGDTQMG